MEEASRHLTGAVDRDLIRRQLSGVRERGYAIAGDRAMTERFMRLVRGSHTGRDSYARMWADIATMRRQIETDQGFSWNEVVVVQVPVFGADGDVVLALYAIGLPLWPTSNRTNASSNGCGAPLSACRSGSPGRKTGTTGRALRRRTAQSPRAVRNTASLPGQSSQWGWGSP